MFQGCNLEWQVYSVDCWFEVLNLKDSHRYKETGKEKDEKKKKEKGGKWRKCGGGKVTNGRDGVMGHIPEQVGCSAVAHNDDHNVIVTENGH